MYKKIFQIISNNAPIPKKFRHFSVMNDILYYVCPATLIKKICIPSNMINDILYAYHTNILGGGHYGIARTYARIKIKYFFPAMQKHIARYVSSCLRCAERKPDTRRKIGKMHPGEICDIYEKFQVDAIGPLKETIRGNKYILCGIDTNSKYAVSRAVKEVNANTLSNFLIRDIFLRFGIPKVIQFDNSSVNKSKIIEELLKKVNCSPVFITPFSHQSQGSV